LASRFSQWSQRPSHQELYTYVGNDPLDKTDPSGNCPSCAIGALVEIGFQLYTGELQNAVSEAGKGNYGALAVSAGKVGVSAISGGVSTIAAAKAATLVSNAYKAANIARVATVVAKVEAVAATQATVAAGQKVTTNAIEGKPLSEGVATAAAVSAAVGTPLSQAGNALSSAASDLGANAATAVKALGQVVSGAAKKEANCSVRDNHPC